MILESPQCKAVFIDLLGAWARRTGVLVGGFVLMNNHVHLALTPPSEDALAMMMGRATACLSRWVNVGEHDVGPNWQGAYYASPMDDFHTLAALRYIERNPVAAGIARRATDWRWSSAAWHAGLGPRPNIITTDYRPTAMEPREWRKLLEDPQADDVCRAIHAAGRSGDPLGDDAWIDRMEGIIGRSLRRRPRGRPSSRK